MLQRTSASNPTIRSFARRPALVMDAQLAALDRTAEVVLHVNPVQRLVGHRRFEDGIALRRITLGADPFAIVASRAFRPAWPDRAADGDAE